MGLAEGLNEGNNVGFGGGNEERTVGFDEGNDVG